MTWTIRIQGQVQGVGFRPFVWRAALERNLCGWVQNGLEGVLIRFNATAEQAADFQQYILQNIPPTARVTGSSLREDETETFFDSFSIKESDAEGHPLLHLTADVAMCAECREEIHTSGNRRYRYPFTTCAICGPRYSILHGLPYDRPLTSMRGFDMCPQCLEEYRNPADRRYYAQTNSCPACGITLRFFALAATRFQEEIRGNEPSMQHTLEAWRRGDIVAIKGIGGFLLTCDATNAEAVARLRHRKHRPSKPLALMYPDLATLQADAEVPPAADAHLLGQAAPIVLLDVLESPASGFDKPGVAPGLNRIGAMLPHAPLFDLLLRDFGKPIVATSGNISHAPIAYDDETAVRDLKDIADFVLTHDRPVVMPQDDSVIALRNSGQALILRRARGWAPAFIQAGLEVPDTTTWALGAEMKDAFTLSHMGNVHVSQYLGDLGDFDTQQRYQMVLEHLSGMFGAKPVRVVIDQHPAYFTTALGQELAEKKQAELVQVQHHKAHFAAVLAENELLDASEPVLGVIWDGTGWGEDGQIWGGEFFTYHASRMERIGHLTYFPVLMGDKMAREPRLSALSACREIPSAEPYIRPKFTETEWNLYRKMAENSALQTSSMGRVFDAVASMLGLIDQASYEGEGAMLLEDLARVYFKKNGFTLFPHETYLLHTPDKVWNIDTPKMLRSLLSDLENGQEKMYIAARFHSGLVDIIRQAAQHAGTRKIAFSGGVFQNALLSDMIENLLSPQFELFFHQQLSPNDENIPFGQLTLSHLSLSHFSPLTSHLSPLPCVSQFPVKSAP